MPDAPITLLAMRGAPSHPSPLASASLILIDLQEEYRTGALPLPRIGDATAGARRLLDLARANGVPVFHVLHATAAGAPIFDPTGPGVAPIPEVAPAGGEERVVKSLPNAFAGTDLHERLARTGRREIIVAGAMTHLCVSSTVRAALDLGYRSTVVADACATRDLPSAGGTIRAADVHATALAELADAFAVVVPGAAAWS